jgi:hypothetical protein
VAAAGVRPTAAASARWRIWEILGALARAELRRLDTAFEGSILLDAYLVDLATATGAVSALRPIIAAARRRCGRARVGLEANAVRRLVPYLASLADVVDDVLALTTPAGNDAEDVATLLNAVGRPGARVIRKTGVLPTDLLELAWREPERWRRQQPLLVVDWAAAPPLTGLRRAALAAAVRAVGGE